MGQPIKIGIFLPFSRTNPLASANISSGLKACFAEKTDREIEVCDYTVTSDSRTIVENLLRAYVVDEIDIAVGNIGYAVLPKVLEELKLTDKILFLTTVGADIVRKKDRHPLVFRNSLFYWQSQYLAGYETFKNDGTIFAATTTLETGYDSFLAFITGTEAAGNDILPFHQCDEGDYIFRPQPCIDKIEALDPKVVAALACGDNAAKIFSEVISKTRSDRLRKVIYSAFFHENPVVKSIGNSLLETHSYFGWADSLLDADTALVGRFMNSWTKASRKSPDAFSILGYDTALMICDALDRCGWEAQDAQALAHALENVRIESPRGMLEMDTSSHTVSGPVYLRKLEKKNDVFHTSVVSTFAAPRDSDPTLNCKISLHRSRWYQDYMFI